jgi:hypothetical protein
MHTRARIQARHNPGERLDQTPVPGAELKPAPLTMKQEMQRFLRQEVSRVAQSQDYGSFDDEDDFSIEDFDNDPDLTTPYTVSELTDEFEQTESMDGTQDPESPVNAPLTASEAVSDVEDQQEPVSTATDTSPPETPSGE